MKTCPYSTDHEKNRIASNEYRAFRVLCLPRVVQATEFIELDPHVEHRPFDCLNCKQPMARLESYFKAPPKRAIRQWLKVELLFRYGERFFAGNSGLDTKCDTLPSTVAYLVAEGHDESDVRVTLARIRELRRQPTSANRKS